MSGECPTFAGMLPGRGHQLSPAQLDRVPDRML